MTNRSTEFTNCSTDVRYDPLDFRLFAKQTLLISVISVFVWQINPKGEKTLV